MPNNYGPGVSRVLDPSAAQFLDVIWQEGKPPTDAELNLLQDIASDWQRKLTLRGTPSGWLSNETNPTADFLTNSIWSNWFRFGRQKTAEASAVMWAVVNGWLIPVTGTRTGTPPGAPDDVDTWNVVALDPPPSNSGDTRVDFAYLEVWLARVPPTPAVLNKPAANSIWKYGNVEGGFTFLPDDIQDPALGFETTERVQVQYRIRVAKGLVGLTTNPDGFDPTVVFGQGAAAAQTSYTFTNMRKALNDPGLWRAGDGTANALGTVDGYTYAIPLAGVFRRNSAGWNGDPSQNLNGAFNRNPLATDRTGIRTFSTTATLAADLAATATSATLVSASNIPLPATPASAVLIKIGDEYMTYTAITGTTLGGLTRGVNGTRAELHRANSTIQVVSGRPDGLFADQIAMTDVLDLRHIVNPNGFDYQALLETSVDKLLRGQLRANWKRSGSGPQGSFVFYQDKISASPPSLGVTALDAPDGIRTVFSDAAVVQRIEAIIAPTGNAPPAAVNANWSLTFTATQTTQIASGKFSAGDVIKFPVASLKTGVSGGDADQIRWVYDSISTAVSLRVDGQNTDVPASQYTVTGSVSLGPSMTPNDDLVITLGGSFPQTTSQIYVTLHAMYGTGRGLARRPNSIHGITFTSPSTELLLNQVGVPATNFGVRTSWLPLWSKFRNTTYKRNVPATSPSYADLGSKTVIISPFRRIIWPTTFTTMDGTAANVNTSAAVVTSSTGAASGSTTFTDSSAPFTSGMVGYALQISNGAQPGRYTIVSFTSSSSVVLDRTVPTGSSLSYTVKTAQGLMPVLAADGVTSKWATTDPLGLFSVSTDTSSTGFANTKNIYVTLPRSIVPGWGEVNVPILHADTSTFAEGINFMLLSLKGASPAAGDSNYVAYNGSGGLTWSVFSTTDFATPTQHPATYNTAFTPAGGLTYAGMRFFNDPRGLGRNGLELPPFYGIARLFGIYEAGDYKLNGSAYNGTDRTARGAGATNLLRQDCSTPVFWVEQGQNPASLAPDSDGDATFVINADAIDISRSTVNPIASFASGNYVIEASIFGFDRGAFDTTQEFRLCLTRARTQANNTTTRSANISVTLSGPTSVLPGPATPTDSMLVNYSRTPYQGDPWGSQNNYIDVPQALGPIQTATAYQIDSTSLLESALTRPNQKAVEVLASMSFATTMGTGRLSGDASTAMDVRNVGYEDPSQYPPTSAVQARPTVLVGALSGDTAEIGTAYHGATERLPLGSLFRDKDFRGGSFDGSTGGAPLLYMKDRGQGLLRSNLTSASSYEQTEVPLDTASVGTGSPGDLIAAVDGEATNYALLVNYRTFRGGSAFMMNGPHPGGEIAVEQPSSVAAPGSHTNVLQGCAMLVRNTVTNVSASEVSAGDELMMLVITNVQRLTDASAHASYVLVGTNGTNEGYAAADLYRLEGHPIMTDNVRLDTDPATITLSKRGA